MKNYNLQINGERIDTGKYMFHLSADASLRDPRTGFVVVPNAEDISDIPEESIKDVSHSWCLGSHENNLEALLSARSAFPMLNEIPMKKRKAAIVDFGKTEIFGKENKWKELCAQEFHPHNAFFEEHKALEQIFNKKSVEFQANLLKSRKIPGGSILSFVPYGVFGTITPSNTSYAMLTAMLEAAVLSGNTLVIKPPVDSPIVACEMADCFEKFLVENYNFPKGIFNVVIGDSKQIVEEWKINNHLDGVFFLGGYKNGKQVFDGFCNSGKKVIIEANGSDFLYVHKDVKNLREIAEHITKGRFTASGQFCVGVKRVAIHEKVYDEILDHILDFTKDYRAGLMSDPKTNLTIVGKINECDYIVESLIKTDGGKLLAGGQRVNYKNEVDPSGIFYQATVIGEVSPESETILDEIFMPILPLTKVGDDLDYTIELMNRSPYKLKASVHALDQKVINNFITYANVGAISVNSSHFNFNGGYLVGGPGNSSISGSGARCFPFEMTRQKVVHNGNKNKYAI